MEIKTFCEVKVYERDGLDVPLGQLVLEVRSHGQQDGLVIFKLQGQPSFTVSANAIREALLSASR